MSSSGGKSSEQFPFAAPGGNASQSSPGSITGASSADAATVITTPSTSQISGEGGVAPREMTSTESDVRMGNAKRIVKRLTRSTSPRTTLRRPPNRDIKRVEIEDATEMRLIEELPSARVPYQHLSDEYSCLHDGYTKLYAESEEEISQMTKCNMAVNDHLRDDARG